MQSLACVWIQACNRQTFHLAVWLTHGWQSRLAGETLRLTVKVRQHRTRTGLSIHATDTGGSSELPLFAGPRDHRPHFYMFLRAF